MLAFLSVGIRENQSAKIKTQSPTSQGGCHRFTKGQSLKLQAYLLYSAIRETDLALGRTHADRLAGQSHLAPARVQSLCPLILESRPWSQGPAEQPNHNDKKEA